MRSILPFLLLAACSEYTIVPEKADPAALSDVTDVVPAEPETNEEDVETEEPTDTETEEPSEDEGGLEPDSECGFHVNNGMMDEAFVMSYPSYSLFSPEVATIIPDEPLTLQFAITADPCGDIELIVMQFAIVDEGHFNEWLYVYQDVQANVASDTGAQFNDASANSVSTSYGELGFTWSDGYWSLGYDDSAYMETLRIPAGETVIFTFRFSATALAPVGAVADVLLSTAIWRDIGTEQEVNGFNDGHEDMWTAVEFVE